MTGYVEEVKGHTEVTVKTSDFIKDLNKFMPELRVFVLIEGKDLKHMGCSLDMPMHEMIGLLQTAQARLRMLDLENIKLRIEATKLKQEQDTKLQEMASSQTPN